MKSPFIDVDNKYNKFFSSFSFFNEEFKPGNHLINLFLDHFSFYSRSFNTKKHIKKLDNITLRASFNPFSTIIVSDASIMNYVATLIFHIHSFNKSIIKTIHRAINITTTEAKLFTIWLTLELATAWFMLYQIVNNLASVVVILIALCMVLMIDLLKEWIWKINVAT